MSGPDDPTLPPPPPELTEEDYKDTEPPGPETGRVHVQAGEDVFYVLTTGWRRGERRPAKVIRVLDNLGKVRLAVFTDGEGDGLCYQHCPTLLAAAYSPDGLPGTWHRG